MCGIAGIYRRSDEEIPSLNRLIDAIMMEISERGWDASGVAATYDDGHFELYKRPVDAMEFIRKRLDVPDDPAPRNILIHTRYKTTGTDPKIGRASCRERV